MNFRILFRGKALYAENDHLWVAKGSTYFAIDYAGNRITSKFKIGGLKQRILASNRLSRQLLREGIHHLIPLKDRSIFITTKRRSYTISSDGVIRNVFTGYTGNKPGHQGVCMTPDGTIFFGEYSVNLEHKNQTKLFRSTDNGMTFRPVLIFDKTVRHIHFVKYDLYEDCLWLGTGDADEECFLMRSNDNGSTWLTVGAGSQDWRAIGVCFTPEYLIWGTDAGSVSDQNHIVRMSRKTNELEILGNVEGPCHGCAGFENGRIFISTGVESGENEKDRFARLKEIIKGSAVDLLKLKKDVWPLILQYGVMRFPLGSENTNKVIFTVMGLRDGGETVMIGVDA